MAASGPSKQPITSSLSAKLLVLTVAFIMLGEVLIYAPSIARYRKTYLEERMAAARLAVLAIQELPGEAVSAELQAKLLAQTDSYNIVLRLPERSVFVRGPHPAPPVDDSFDLRETMLLEWVTDAFATMARRENRVIRVIGPAPRESDVVVEVALDEAPIRKAMIRFSLRVFGVSLVVAVMAGMFVFLSLRWTMVRPVHRVINSMTAFRADPMDERADMPPSTRRDEIGSAMRELGVMQKEVRQALQQRRRLAALGAAVAKINHDLRNSLTKAMLAYDRLSTSDDPVVKRVLPQLFDAIERATRLCSETLNFASRDAPALTPSRFSLHDLIADVGRNIAGIKGQTDGMRWINEVERELEIEADREQLFRALVNIGRNAYENGAREVRLSIRRTDSRVVIDVADDGPGLPAKAQANLFTPFLGSTRPGGTGLGLVIVRDVLRAHGGDIRLTTTGEEGTTFSLELPERVAHGAKFRI